MTTESLDKDLKKLSLMQDKNTYPKMDWKGYFLIALVAMSFYLYTLAPGALWNDSPIFQLRVFLGDYVGNLGLALSHPLYIFIGRLFSLLPFHNVAYKVNLVSAVFGALSVANLFLLLRQWKINYRASLLASLTLMVSHTFWVHSVIAEVYTLYTCLFLVELILLTLFLESGQKKYLFALFLVNGLNISNHLLALLSLVVYFSYALWLLYNKKISRGNLFLLCSLTILGALPYEILIIREYLHTGSFLLTLKSALVGSSAWQGSVLNTNIFCRRNFKNLVLFMGMNFPVFHIYYSVPGAIKFWKKRDRRYPLLFGGILLIYFVFAFRYTVADQYVFYLPVYIMTAFLIGLGLDSVTSKKGRQRYILLSALFLSAISPIIIYQKTADLTERYRVNIGVSREIPYRNSYQYFLNPSKKNYRGTRKYALHVARQAEKGSIIIPDYTIINSLIYFQQVEGIGSGLLFGNKPNAEGDFPRPSYIEVTPANIKDLLKKHKIYLTSDLPQYSPPWILKNFRLKKEGILYQVLLAA